VDRAGGTLRNYVKDNSQSISSEQILYERTKMQRAASAHAVAVGERRRQAEEARTQVLQSQASLRGSSSLAPMPTDRLARASSAHGMRSGAEGMLAGPGMRRMSSRRVSTLGGEEYPFGDDTALTEDQVRARRWFTLYVLGRASNLWLDNMVHNRIIREQMDSATKRAVTIIKRSSQRRRLRMRLEQLRRSMINFRRLARAFLDKIRLKIRRRAAECIRSFVEGIATKGMLVKSIRNYLYKVAFIQRGFRHFKRGLDAQLGCITIQFDRYARSKASVEQFLTPDAYKLYLSKVGPKLLKLAESTTRAGQKAIALERSEQAAKPRGSIKPGKPRGARRASFDGGKRRASVDTGSHSHSPGGPTELTIGSDRILQIDFDTRLSVIATHLRARKSEHVEQLAAYAAEQRAAEALLSEQRELEQARQMFGFFAEEEAADIGGKSSLMTIQRPHLRLIANNQELSQMVTDAILQTGDRIAADLPVDPNISVRRVLIRAGAIPPYGSSAS